MRLTTSLVAATLMAQSTFVAASLRGNGWDGAAAAADEHRELKSSKGSGSKSGKADLIAYISPYPDSGSSASGSVKVSIDKDGDISIQMDVDGVEASCSSTGSYAPNGCGIHIHEGATCNTATTIGGHFWSPSKFSSDPWAPVQYDSNASGESTFEIYVDEGNGYGLDINHGRAFVIHNAAGGRIGCGLLEYY